LPVSPAELEVVPSPGTTEFKPGSVGCGLGASGIACCAAVSRPADAPSIITIANDPANMLSFNSKSPVPYHY
jgi:hypothetical protein